MLVLSRKEEETLVINEGQIRITILAVKGGQVRIGIDAPREMTVDRLEIHNKKLLEGNIVTLDTRKDRPQPNEDGELHNKAKIKYVNRRRKGAN